MGEEVGIYQRSTHTYIQLLITKVILQGRGSVAQWWGAPTWQRSLSWDLKGGWRLEAGGGEEGDAPVTGHWGAQTFEHRMHERNLSHPELHAPTHLPVVREKLAPPKMWAILNSFEIRARLKILLTPFKDSSRFNTIPIDSSTDYFVDIDKLILKCIWSRKDPDSPLWYWKRKTHKTDFTRILYGRGPQTF